MALFPTDVPVAAEVTRAARGIRGRGDAWVIAYHPVARLNPYQSLLYCRAWESGFAPVSAVRTADLAAVRCALPMNVGAAVHLHWTSTVIGDATTGTEADARVVEFMGQLRQLQCHGVRVVWTVHNRLPHRCEHPRAEIRLRKELAELADVVHVMTPDTPAEVGELFSLPEDRLLHAPHPSYVGAYPTHYDRDLVRFELGFDPGDFVVGTIGSIQPYKGVDELIDATADPGTIDPRLRILVAGTPGQDAASRELVSRLRRAEMIRSVPARLDDQSISRLVSALDVMVLPFRATLNSGSALLALSFGVPIVAPRIGPFRSLAERGYCLAYDRNDSVGLSQALKDSVDWAAGVDRELMRKDMVALSGPIISERFFAGLRTRLRRRDG